MYSHIKEAHDVLCTKPRHQKSVLTHREQAPIDPLSQKKAEELADSYAIKIRKGAFIVGPKITKIPKEVLFICVCGSCKGSNSLVFKSTKKRRPRPTV